MDQLTNIYWNLYVNIDSDDEKIGSNMRGIQKSSIIIATNVPECRSAVARNHKYKRKRGVCEMRGMCVCLGVGTGRVLAKVIRRNMRVE